MIRTITRRWCLWFIEQKITLRDHETAVEPTALDEEVREFGGAAVDVALDAALAEPA